MNINKEILDIFLEYNLRVGRIISASKSAYMLRFPQNIVVFNANIITPNLGKIWYGDLDITKDADILKEISERIGEPLYVLRELDCRFEKENLPIKELIKKSIWNTNF